MKSLSELMKVRDLTVDALVKTSGVSSGSIVRIKREGLDTCGVGTLRKLAAGLGMTLAEIIEIIADVTPEPAPEAQAEDYPFND